MDSAQCAHFGVCSGCQLQQLSYPEQIAHKQSQFEAILAASSLRPEFFDDAVAAQAWHYRHRARLGVRYENDTVAIGFRGGKRRRELINLETCPVLPERVSELLPLLRSLIENLDEPASVAQLDVAVVAEEMALTPQYRFPLTDKDRAKLDDFFATQKLSLGEELSYTLEQWDLRLSFHLSEFTQINPYVNELMIKKVLSCLEVRPDERIADLFCGNGNFSLPLAREGARVVGFEGSQRQVQYAEQNAEQNNLAERAQFKYWDLSQASQALRRELETFDKLLIDPPRSGAPAVVASLFDESPRRIVYVSCSPESLAHDATVLVQKHGYQYRSATLVDMFPHTKHIESISLFGRD